nr:MAG TPA: hypothetical protein [Bacteriophage sp.]DAT91959.1 MAG TPA: hypothetical protein [Caudoviricetes sp.]
MKCPYNCKSETHYQRWVQEYDEDLRAPKACSQIDQHIFELDDCLKEDCGAWQNGRCCYASVNLNNQ